MKKRISILLVLMLLFTFAFVGCDLSAPDDGGGNEGNGDNGDSSGGGNNYYFMSMLMSISLSDGDKTNAEKDIWTEAEKMEEQVSVKFTTSDLYKINNSKVGEVISIGSYTKEMLDFSFDIYDVSGGALNIASLPSTTLWGFSAFGAENFGSIPSDDDIAKTLALIDLNKSFKYDRETGTVTKLIDGAMLDLGAIAKGYMADVAIDIAKDYGCTVGYVNVGGTLKMLGNKSDGTPYTVGITDPNNSLFGGVCMRISMSGEAVATSGDYVKYFIGDDGVRYCHIIDGRTGVPIANGMRSVTIVDESGLLCDTYSTLGFVLGAVEAEKFFNENNIKTVLIYEVDDKTYYKTTAGIEVVLPTNLDYIFDNATE